MFAKASRGNLLTYIDFNSIAIANFSPLEVVSTAVEGAAYDICTT